MAQPEVRYCEIHVVISARDKFSISWRDVLLFFKTSAHQLEFALKVGKILEPVHNSRNQVFHDFAPQFFISSERAGLQIGQGLPHLRVFLYVSKQRGMSWNKFTLLPSRSQARVNDKHCPIPRVAGKYFDHFFRQVHPVRYFFASCTCGSHEHQISIRTQIKLAQSQAAESKDCEWGLIHIGEFRKRRVEG